ncbi:conserved hypothetical protein, partial [Ricinus communis]
MAWLALVSGAGRGRQTGHPVLLPARQPPAGVPRPCRLRTGERPAPADAALAGERGDERGRGRDGGVRCRPAAVGGS